MMKSVRFGGFAFGRQRLALAAFGVVFVLLLSPGCASIRKDAATGQPPRDPTPFEQVLALNFTVSATNDLVQQGAIAAEQTGVLPTAPAAKVVKATRAIAVHDKRLTQLFAQGYEKWSPENVAEVRSLIRWIGEEAGALAADGSLGIKNPNAQATFQAQAAAITVLADRIVGLLEATGAIR